MRPNLTARVFKMKLDSIMKNLTKNGYVGHWISHIQVIESQKRGLPHSHILICLSNDDIPKVDEFDKFFCAEIPNPVTHPRLHAIVARNMLHVICDQQCLTTNKVCSKHFHKEPNEITCQQEG